MHTWKRIKSNKSVEDFITLYLNEYYTDDEIDSLIIDARLDNYSARYLEV